MSNLNENSADKLMKCEYLVDILRTLSEDIAERYEYASEHVGGLVGMLNAAAIIDDIADVIETKERNV